MKGGNSTLDDAHDAAAVVIAGVAHRDQALGGTLEMEVRLVCVCVCGGGVCGRTSVQTRGSMPPRTAGKKRHTKPTMADSRPCKLTLINCYSSCVRVMVCDAQSELGDGTK